MFMAGDYGRNPYSSIWPRRIQVEQRMPSQREQSSLMAPR
jgi:hypothetical protein